MRLITSTSHVHLTHRPRLTTLDLSSTSWFRRRHLYHRIITSALSENFLPPLTGAHRHHLPARAALAARLRPRLLRHRLGQEQLRRRRLPAGPEADHHAARRPRHVPGQRRGQRRGGPREVTRVGQRRVQVRAEASSGQGRGQRRGGPREVTRVGQRRVQDTADAGPGKLPG